MKLAWQSAREIFWFRKFMPTPLRKIYIIFFLILIVYNSEQRHSRLIYFEKTEEPCLNSMWQDSCYSWTEYSHSRRERLAIFGHQWTHWLQQISTTDQQIPRLAKNFLEQFKVQNLLRGLVGWIRNLNWTRWSTCPSSGWMSVKK